MKSRILYFKGALIVFLATGLFFLAASCSGKQLHRNNALMMGTFIEVLSFDRRAAGIVFSELKRIESLLSKYDPQSEASRLNEKGKLAVSPETFFVLTRARELWSKTRGAFDVTVAPLMDIWGFTDKKYRLPSQEEINSVKRVIGPDKILLNPEGFMVEFSAPGMKIDLGGIAKGYAVDCAVSALKRKGVKDCLINAGGDIYCLGSKNGRPWKVAVRNPRKSGVVEYLDLQDKAVATSGDYEQYFTIDGKRFSHIFDPGTGYPADSGVISVTVIADDCLSADALATAIFVLGKDRWLKLSGDFPGIKAEVFEKDNISQRQGL